MKFNASYDIKDEEHVNANLTIAVSKSMAEMSGQNTGGELKECEQLMSASGVTDKATAKKYEDIVNVHFYRGALPDLWYALRDVVLDGHLPAGGNGVFHLVFAAVALSGLMIRSPRFHAVLAPAMAVVISAYVVLLFARLA